MLFRSYVRCKCILPFAALAAIATGGSAQAPSSPPPEPSPAAWRVGPIDMSGLIDGYLSYNANHPSNSANGQVNDLYNFDDKTGQLNLSELRLTLNHDPEPIGAHRPLLGPHQ